MSSPFSISPAQVFSLASIAPATSLLSTAAAPSTALTGLDTSSTVVELSGLGQLLFAVSAFRNRLSVLRPGAAESGIGQNFGSDLASLAAQEQAFVDAFNGLQTTVAGLQASIGSFAGDAVFGRLVEALNAQASATFANGDSSFKTLAQIGINFEAPASPENPGTLSIDLAALQNAFAADPAGVFALLARAAQAFESLADGFASPNAGPTADSLLAIVQAQLTLGFSDSLLGGTGSGLPGLTSLLLIDSLTRGGATALQQLLAANQFALVSSLLG